MNLKEFVKIVQNSSISEITEKFNELEVDDRKAYLSALEKDDYNKFIKDIRKQAVKDF